MLQVSIAIGDNYIFKLSFSFNSDEDKMNLNKILKNKLPTEVKSVGSLFLPDITRYNAVLIIQQLYTVGKIHNKSISEHLF